MKLRTIQLLSILVAMNSASVMASDIASFCKSLSKSGSKWHSVKIDPTVESASYQNACCEGNRSQAVLDFLVKARLARTGYLDGSDLCKKNSTQLSKKCANINHELHCNNAAFLGQDLPADCKKKNKKEKKLAQEESNILMNDWLNIGCGKYFAPNLNGRGSDPYYIEKWSEGERALAIQKKLPECYTSVNSLYDFCNLLETENRISACVSDEGLIPAGANCLEKLTYQGTVKNLGSASASDQKSNKEKIEQEAGAYFEKPSEIKSVEP